MPSLFLLLLLAQILLSYHNLKNSVHTQLAVPSILTLLEPARIIISIAMVFFSNAMEHKRGE